MVPGMLRFAYVENFGAAFGLFEQHAALLLIATAAMIAALLAFLFVKKNTLPKLAEHGLWLLAGGAVGNFADRLFFGYVVDFLEIRFVSFPVFNIADCCVTVSTVLLMGWILSHREAQPNAK